MQFSTGLITAIALVGLSISALSEDAPSVRAIRESVEKALPLLENSSRESADQRKCFTCHHQGLPILTFINAEKRGFKIDAENLRRQIEHTMTHLKRGKGNYLKGTGQGGRADTAGSALWALDAAEHPRDEITDAVVHFLLQWNRDTPNWSAQSKRPPSEGSRFTSTFLALRGLDGYAFEAKEAPIKKRREAARTWLIETEPETTEDRVFRLRALSLIGAEAKQVESAARDLLERQRDDGGWAQLADLESDAYATGSALTALHVSKTLDPDSIPYQRGLKFLISSQEDDGSWHVISRSRPIQEFYESGFPHEKDQFISASGTGWATLALLFALPARESEVSKQEIEP